MIWGAQVVQQQAIHVHPRTENGRLLENLILRWQIGAPKAALVIFAPLDLLQNTYLYNSPPLARMPAPVSAWLPLLELDKSSLTMSHD